MRQQWPATTNLSCQPLGVIGIGDYIGLLCPSFGGYLIGEVLEVQDQSSSEVDVAVGDLFWGGGAFDSEPF